MRITNAGRRVGLDTVSYVTPYLDGIGDHGIHTIFRYVNYDAYYRDTPCTDPNDWFKSLSTQEFNEILAKDFDVGIFQRGIGKRNKGGAAAGEQVGKNAVHNLRGIGVPEGATILCDCEWAASHCPTKQEQVFYIEGWAKVLSSEGFIAALYVSHDLKLNSAELYALKYVRSYMKAASTVPTVDNRGFQAVQSLEYFYHTKENRFYVWDKKWYGHDGLRCDLDMLCIDGKGDRWRVVSA